MTFIINSMKTSWAANKNANFRAIHFPSIVIIVVAAMCLSSCGTFASEDNSEMILHTWLLPKCPSSTPDPRIEGSPIVTGLLISAAGNVIDWMGNALAKAAKEDREGKATYGTSPSYLWWHNKESKTRGLMSCAVVTLSSSKPANWCTSNESPFMKSEASAICRYFVDPTSPANQNPSLTPASWSGNTLPALYAEIKLESSTDDRGVLPKLVSLYYPKGIHGGKFAKEKPRNLQLTVAATTPEGTNALSSLVIRLDNITPNPELQIGDKIASAVGARAWAAVLAVPEKYTPPDTSGAIIPVNVASEVREIGDPDIFLQALAVAFASQKDVMKEVLKDKISSATSDADPNAIQSSYDAQSAAIYTAEANIRAACKPTPPATMNNSAVRGLYLVLLEGHRKLASLSAPKNSIAFNPDAQTLEGLRSGTAADICKLFL